MSSTTTTITTMSLGRKITTFARKNPWPDPHLSIGECWCSMGPNRCWEAIGPAKERYDEVSPRIKSLLECQSEYLSEGVCVRRRLMFDLYMIGRTEVLAKPIIIFSSENKTQRQRAQKLVRESGILNGYPGIGLGESSRPLRLSGSPKPLGDQLAPDDIEMTENMDTSTVSDTRVYYSSQTNDIRGIPITIKKAGDATNPKGRKCTLGLVCTGNELLGLTVAHAFFDDCDDENSNRGDLEFSLEDENPDEDAYDYSDDFVHMTSRGSASPEQQPQDGQLSHEQPIWSDIEAETSFPAEPIENGKNKKEATETPLKILGHTIAICQPTRMSNLDWALIKIDCTDLCSSISRMPKNPWTQNVEASLTRTKRVQAITGSGGCVSGSITGSSTFMQLPESTAFQEVWAVQLDGTLQFGDSGSWVIDPSSGSLYGYIVAGDPQTSIAYIVPAYQAVSDIERQLGCKVTFPSPEHFSRPQVTSPYVEDLMDSMSDSSEAFSDSSFTEDENAESDPYPFYLDFNVSFSTLNHNFVGAKTWSSQPTNLFETLYDLNGKETNTGFECALTKHQRLEKPSTRVEATDSPVLGQQLQQERHSVSWNTYELETPVVSDVVDSKSNARDLDYTQHADSHTHLFSTVPKDVRPVQDNAASQSAVLRKALPRGRQRGLTSLEKKQARDVREAKACWACHISKTKCSPCSPGSPCEQCTRLMGKRRFPLFKCFNDPLETLNTFLVPDYLFSHFTCQNVESFIARNTTGWGSESMWINLSWGLRRPIVAKVVSLNLVPHSELAFSHQLQSSDADRESLLTRKPSLPLGIPISEFADMENKYQRYVENIVQNDSHQYVDIAYVDQESGFPERLLGLICSFYSNSRSTGDNNELLQSAIEMHVACTILERSLILEADSQQRAHEIFNARFLQGTVPVIVQRQIKLAVFNVQRERVVRVLLEWGKLMWNLSLDSEASWVTAFSAFIMIILAIDKTIISAYYFCESNISFHRSEANTEHAAFRQLVTLTQRELFERCKEIFHCKFKTRKIGKAACNPIRDGVAAFGKRVPEQRTLELVEDLQLLVKDFEPEIRAHRAQPPRDSDAEPTEYTDAGRLACVFLDDFLDR